MTGTRKKFTACLLMTAVLLSCGTRVVHGQMLVKILGHSADTIYPKLLNASDHEKMKAYNQLAFYHSLYDPDSALYYARKAYEMAERFKDENEKRFALRNMGNACALASNYRQAMAHLHQALGIAEKQNDLNSMLELYTDIGKLNYDIEDYQASLKYIDKLIPILEDPDNRASIRISPIEEAILYFLSGGACREAKEYEQGTKYFQKYIDLSRKHAFPDELNRHAIKSLAEIYDYAGDLDSALKYTYMARAYLPQNMNKEVELHVGYEGSIGTLLSRKGEHRRALGLLKHSYVESKQDSSFFYSSAEAIDVGDNFLALGQYDSARIWYDVARSDAAVFSSQLRKSGDDEKQDLSVYVGYQYLVNISREELFQRYYRLMAHLHGKLARLHQITEDYLQAFEHSEWRSSYKDSLAGLTQKVEERKMQVRMEAEKMEQQLDLLEKDNALKQEQLQNTSLIFLGVILALLSALLLVYIFFRQRRIHEAQEKILLEQRLLRSQMNPHFIFNSLASVQNFIVKQDDTRASIYLSRFSELVRSILNNSLEEQITLEQELSTIENYLELQKVRFPKKFDYALTVDERLDIESTFIPPMLAQPFIENAIEHGIKHKEGKGHISVRFGHKESGLRLTVEDDGIGRKKAHEIRMRQDRDHRSLAIALTRDRIAALNKKLKRHITLDIIDLADETGRARGTRVVIEMTF